MNLEKYLAEHTDAELSAVILSLAEAVKEISAAFALATHDETGKAGTQNVYGEEQLALDVRADQILQQKMTECEHVGLVASEEQDDEVSVGEGAYAVCYDPLDGSSLADVNLSVGTIVGIYKESTLIGVKGDDQAGAVVAVYGPRTTLLVTVRAGVHEFLLNAKGEFVMNNEGLTVGEGKMFAPGNLKACKEREEYIELMNFWCRNEYKLRYSGGMVPDINQILIKGKGVFLYPGYSEQPEGKLRLLMECAPMALLVEEAGGAASNGKMRILEIEAEKLSQQTPIYIGSNDEVARCKEYLG